MNARRQEATRREEVLIGPTHRSHMANLRMYDQWQIQDDGATQAKV